MISVIKNILEENNYKLVKKINSSVNFFENISPNKKDYYLIYDIGKFESNKLLNDSIKESENKFNSLRVHEGDVEKNTTAVYLLRTEKEIKTSDPLWHRICEIEEMVAYMKRNVLMYTQDELNEVNQIKINFTEQIRNFLQSSANFEEYKKNNDIKYQIFSKIFIKLHCLTYNFESKDFNNIDKNIEEKMSNIDNVTLKENMKLVLKSIDEVEKGNERIGEFLDKYINILASNNDNRIDDSKIEEKIKKNLSERR